MLVSGIALGLVSVLLLVGLLIADGFSTPAELLWPIGSILLVWVVFVRPCVELDQSGVTLRNLIRDVAFTWPAVDIIEQRWNLKIYTPDDDGFGSWAIASQRPQGRAIRSPQRGFGLMVGGRFNVAAVSSPDGATPSDVMVARRGSAADVAAVIDRSKNEYLAAVERQITPRQETAAHRSYATPAIAAAVLGIAFILASFYWG